MANMAKSFKELTPDLQAFAGGKGGMLARMFQDGYPVPEGFIVLPSAFQEERLNNEAWNEIKAYLNEIRKNYEGAFFAVRSSALSEDSTLASFAGEFETVLNVKTDQEVLEAIDTVYRSRQSERVKVYSSVQGIDQSHQIALVVQLMVQSEISGVLFTADPITGSYTSMTGNFVYGLGEQLVSGEANAYSFKFMRPKGKYEGPDALRRYAIKLFKYAARLEKELGGPQDIEWAVARGKLYILQARPITTLKAGNLDTYEINDSLTGDLLWVNTNIGEAIPDVMTPLTWSVVRSLDQELNMISGFYLTSGNICGRAYTNISLRLSVLPTFGIDVKHAIKINEDVFGQMPEGISIPIYPFTRLGLIKVIITNIKPYLQSLLKASKNSRQYLKDAPAWCGRMMEHIRQVKTKEELLSLWNDKLRPYDSKTFWVLLAGGSKAFITLLLKKKLTKLVGTEDANALLSNLRGSSGLASLGPVMGISRIVKGEMSRKEYLMQYGHRGPHEFELSIPHPGEDPDWLEKQIVQRDEHPDIRYKKCQNTRKAERYFKERDVPIQFVDFSVRGLSKGELDRVKSAVGLENLIDIAGKEYAKSNLKYIVHDTEEMLLAYPLLF